MYAEAGTGVFSAIAGRAERTAPAGSRESGRRAEKESGTAKEGGTDGKNPED